jgi:hypothetical protein
MSGHHPISELFDRFSPEEQREIEEEKNRLLAEIALREELYKSLCIPQKELEEMHIPLSSLRDAVEAMGGELIVTARFPNAEVCLEGQYSSVVG